VLTVKVKWHRGNPVDPDPRTVISETRPAVVPSVHWRAAQRRRRQGPAPQPHRRHGARRPSLTHGGHSVHAVSYSHGIAAIRADTSVIASG